jgi:3-hydroxyacyl-CoA dehydrogenase
MLIADIQDAAANPERVVLGHPSNPPHLMPLVEVVGGRLTSEDAVKKALAFYRSIGKRPIHIRREIKDHIANRMRFNCPTSFVVSCQVPDPLSEGLSNKYFRSLGLPSLFGAC